MISILSVQYCIGQRKSFEVDWLPDAVGDKRWRPEIGFDSNRSFFNDRTVKFLGLRLGAEYRGVHRFGLAFYGMTRPESYFGVNISALDASVDKEVQYTAAYVSLFYERVIIKSGKWELSAPVNLGAGSLKGSYKDNQDEYLPYLETAFSTIGTGHSLKYEIWPWLEPEIGSGFRLVFNSEPEVRNTLQKPYYVIKVSIKLGELYKAIVKNTDKGSSR